MKRLIVFLVIALCVLLLAPYALGQSVGASQIKKQANGGLVANAANALAVGVYRATTAPSGAIAGQFWCDTTSTPCSLKTYDGSAWAMSPNTAIATQATLASLPATPTDGQIVWITGQSRAVVYVSAVAKWFYLDSTGRAAQADYAINIFSSDTLASPGNTTGTLAAGGSMTVGAHSCAVTHYSTTGGETLPGGTYTVTTTSGNQTMALTFAATGIGVAGKRIYCSKVGTTTPLYLVTSIDDTTTGTYSVTAADASFLLPVAPDEDFSAPIPTDWVFQVPDRSYGGCGATPTGLLCSALKFSAVAGVGGVRLYYPIVGDPDVWRASWRVTRYAKGFTGIATTVTAVAVGLASAGTGTPFSAINSYYMGTDLTPPFSSIATPTLRWNVRLNGGNPSSTAVFLQPYPPIVADTALYVAMTGRKETTEYSLRWSISRTANDFNFAPVQTAQSTTQRSYTVGYPLPTGQVTHVGIALEHISNAYAATGAVVKIADFRWASE